LIQILSKVCQDFAGMSFRAIRNVIFLRNSFHLDAFFHPWKKSLLWLTHEIPK